MSYVSSEDAADRVQEREDAIWEASTKLDDGISALCDVFNLPSVTIEGWGSRLASRITDQHEAHVSAVRQQLRLDSHNLRMFHARPSTKPKDQGAEASSPPSDSKSQPSNAASSSGQSNAAALLVALVVKAVKNASKVDSLFQEFDDLQSTLTANGTLTLADIIFIRNSKPNILACRDRLKEDAVKLKDTFATYKKCFYLLSDETELNKTLRVIRASTVSAEIFATNLGPAVEDILRLKRERDRAVEQASTIGEELMTAWLSLPDARVEQEAYEVAIAQFDPLETLVSNQEAEHNGVMMFIVLMFEVALHTPASVPFNGEDVDVELLLVAFDEYEKLTEQCREMIEASEPIIETLTDFVSHLHAAAGPTA
ncbi:hypothetical protein C8T65DRAFT_747086 [Cerioporus squamosus]|nr:hypothetical protein C8T65DRAFT_747086 [Cerioporus squamosus]